MAANKAFILISEMSFSFYLWSHFEGFDCQLLTLDRESCVWGEYLMFVSWPILVIHSLLSLCKVLKPVEFKFNIISRSWRGKVPVKHSIHPKAYTLPQGSEQKQFSIGSTFKTDWMRWFKTAITLILRNSYLRPCHWEYCFLGHVRHVWP